MLIPWHIIEAWRKGRSPVGYFETFIAYPQLDIADVRAAAISRNPQGRAGRGGLSKEEMNRVLGAISRPVNYTVEEAKFMHTISETRPSQNDLATMIENFYETNGPSGNERQLVKDLNTLCGYDLPIPALSTQDPQV